MSTNEKTQGIIIAALPYRDDDCIFTLFTPTEGVVKLFFKNAFKKNRPSTPLTPTTIVEAVFSRGRSELHRCQEVSVLDYMQSLRNALPVLNTACDMLQAVQSTQQVGKPAPELYTLLISMLHGLAIASCPTTIGASFRLKLLRYEGLIGMLSHCSVCSCMLDCAWIQQGEILCRQHTSRDAAIFLDKDEYDIVLLLLFSRHLNELANCPLPTELEKKIHEIFDSLTK